MFLRPVEASKFLAVVLLVATACGGGGQRVRLTIPSGLLEPFPIYVCEMLGFFRDEGVAVTIEALQGSKGLEAMIGGSADARYSSAIETLQAAERGKRLKAFFVGQRTMSAMLVVATRNAGRVQRIEDLKGSVLGVSTFGSPQHLALNRILAQHGLTPADVQVVTHGNGPSAVASLEHGKVDAGMINGSAYTVLRRRVPGVRVLVDPRKLEATRDLVGPDYVNYSLMATEEWLGRNPEVARRMVRAMKRTFAWISERSVEEVLTRLPEHLRSADADADLESLGVIIGGLSKDGLMPSGGPEVLRRLGGVSMERLREHGIELSQTFTNEFVEEGR